MLPAMTKGDFILKLLGAFDNGRHSRKLQRLRNSTHYLSTKTERKQHLHLTTKVTGWQTAGLGQPVMAIPSLESLTPEPKMQQTRQREFMDAKQSVFLQSAELQTVIVDRSRLTRKRLLMNGSLVCLRTFWGIA
jgi:hypothetical protein